MPAFNPMPRILPINASAKKKMKLLYAEGQGPADIALAMKSRGITISAKQVSNLVGREEWAREKKAIVEARQKGAKEVLEEARASGAAEFAEILEMFKAGHLVDARRLRDGWELVEDAAGASSLMRAKGLLAQRTMKFFALDGPVEPVGSVHLLAQFYARPINLTTEAVSPEGESKTVDEINVAAEDPSLDEEPSIDLDFDEKEPI